MLQQQQQRVVGGQQKGTAQRGVVRPRFSRTVSRGNVQLTDTFAWVKRRSSTLALEWSIAKVRYLIAHASSAPMDTDSVP